MSRLAIPATALLLGIAMSVEPALAVKKTPYEPVRINVAEVFQPDPAFKAMIASLASAVSNKKPEALFSLVGPSFVWTVSGSRSENFNHGLSAVDNFKILFGFRAAGAADGPGEGGPFWDDLASFAADGSFYRVPDANNLVCGPLLAEAASPAALERARKRLQTDDDTAWYFTAADHAVMAAPEENSAPVGRTGVAALPVLGAHPAQDTDSAPKPSHLEVLLPSGKSGWIPASAARPLESNRLCFSKTSGGEWKISGFDEAAQ